MEKPAKLLYRAVCGALLSLVKNFPHEALFALSFFPLFD